MKRFTFFIIVVSFTLSGMSFSQSNFTNNKNKNPAKLLNQTSNSGTDYLQRTGEWPYGSSGSLAVDSLRDIIFLGSGGAVLILDGSNKTNPQLITDEIRTAGLVEDIFYDASTERLYLACGEGGYEIWNVEDPSNPFFYSRNEIYYADVETPVGHVQVNGNFAVFECAWGYIHSVNVSDPYNPYQVSFNGIVGNPAHNISLDQSGYIHATGQQNYVSLYLDGSGQLHTAGQLPIYNCNAVFNGSQALYVSQEDYLYIIWNGGVNVNPVDVGGVTNIEVRGTLAYIINNSGINIWDVTNNANPFLIASAGTQSSTTDLNIAGNYAYVSVGSKGLNIFDISNPFSPQLVGMYDTYSTTRNTVIKDNIAYVAHSDDGLLMIDISNKERPQLLGQFQTSSYNYDVELKGSLAFLACWEDGFKIVDVSDPTMPSEVSGINNINASKLEVNGNYAYVVEYYPPNTNCNINVINVTDPNNPFEVSSIPFTALVQDLVYYNGYLFVADYTSGLKIIDVSDPQNPFEASNLSLPKVEDVFIKDNYAYICASDWPPEGGLYIYDITNPVSPVEKGYYGTPGFSSFDVEVAGSYAYVNDGEDIWLFYLDDFNPVFYDQYRLPDFISDIYADGKYIYISNFKAGLSIYKNNLIENPPLSNWEFQTSGITEDIWAVDFTSLTNGWAAANYGILLHTTDGGDNWQTMQVGASADNFRDLDFVNENTGWVSGENSAMYKTTNGGLNWSALNVPTSSIIRSICFLNESLGWAVTLEDYKILKTTDGGETWTQQFSGLSGNLHHVDVCFTDENNGFIIGFILGSQSQDYILKTTDGGQTWNTNFNYQDYNLSSLYFVNNELGWVGGMNGFLIKTTDAGDTWQIQNSETGNLISDLFFFNESNGWFTGFEGTLYNTNDGGTSWLHNNVLIQDDLRSVYFVNQTNGWAVGSNGIILHYHEAVTNTETNVNQKPENFALYQNYPNPFNPSTHIKYQIAETGTVILKIFDVLGNEVATLVNENKFPGIYDVEFSGSSLSSGIYFYKLQVYAPGRAGSFTHTKKMILLK